MVLESNVACHRDWFLAVDNCDISQLTSTDMSMAACAVLVM